MRRHKGFLTPEERARITELQDLFIECYVERKKAVADEQEERIKSVEAEIDSLLREREEIEIWAVLGSGLIAHGDGCIRRSVRQSYLDL